MSAVELWAGVECTINRVHQAYFNQIKSTGHLYRLRDLERLAGLGITTLRYPCLWEMVAPDGDLSRAEWSWIDERLHALRDLKIRPIVGLLHHGSGPTHTHLCDPQFPEKFAAYARAFALRYPWIEYYTPINEPLTTARFSGLYGFWYPHARDDASFSQALFHQCRAITLGMQAVRHINPQARLVQTEDLGKISSTPPLQYQADYENERRWLSLDVLCGRLTASHPLWKKMTIGVDERQLWYAQENPCPPDIIGINYYLSSDRFLDHRLDLHPHEVVGGNGKDRYVDIMSAHTPDARINGHRNVLKSVWERYRLPVAITECHIDSSRDEQLRWLNEAWEAAAHMREGGADIRAVTVWAVFGSTDWNTLVTKHSGHYETGAFDVRSSEPRPTAIAQLMQTIAAGRPYTHPVVQSPGWWYRDCRTLDRRARFQCIKNKQEYNTHPGQQILLTGASGTLGHAFSRICEYRALPYRLLSRRQMDIADEDTVEHALDALNPWAVVNAAGYVKVGRSNQEQEECFRENTEGPAVLARACRQRRIPLLTFSTDLVFDGTKPGGYFEHDAVNPQNAYGRSKAEAERIVTALYPDALIVRTSNFFGPWDPYNFLTKALMHWHSGRTFPADQATVMSPTYVPDLAHTCIDLLIDGQSGIWHLTNGEALTWHHFTHCLAQLLNLPPRLIPTSDPAQPGQVRNLSLNSSRGRLLPPLHNALQRYIEEMECISIDEVCGRVNQAEGISHESFSKH